MRPLELAARLAACAMLATSAAGSALAQDPAPTVVAPVIEPEARAALDRMAAYLRTLDAFELNTETTIDLVTESGQRVQLDGTGAYKVRRPNQFVIAINTDWKKRTLFYDGKQVTLYAPELGFYASTPAPATIAATLEALRTKYGIAVPIEELFQWNDPALAKPDELDSGWLVGEVTIDGARTDHYAFRRGEVDWQIWIQQGDRPLPRKIVIVDRSDLAQPAYSARLTWKLNPTLTNADFAFRPAANAKAIRLTAIGEGR